VQIGIGTLARLDVPDNRAKWKRQSGRVQEGVSGFFGAYGTTAPERSDVPNRRGTPTDCAPRRPS